MVKENLFNMLQVAINSWDSSLDLKKEDFEKQVDINIEDIVHSFEDALSDIEDILGLDINILTDLFVKEINENQDFENRISGGFAGYTKDFSYFDFELGGDWQEPRRAFFVGFKNNIYIFLSDKDSPDLSILKEYESKLITMKENDKDNYWYELK